MLGQNRFTTGERVGIDEQVLLRGMPVSIRFRSSGVLAGGVGGNAFGEETGGMLPREISLDASWTGDMGTETEEGGVGTVRAN